MARQGAHRHTAVAGWPTERTTGTAAAARGERGEMAFMQAGFDFC